MIEFCCSVLGQSNSNFLKSLCVLCLIQTLGCSSPNVEPRETVVIGDQEWLINSPHIDTLGVHHHHWTSKVNYCLYTYEEAKMIADSYEGFRLPSAEECKNLIADENVRAAYEAFDFDDTGLCMYRQIQGYNIPAFQCDNSKPVHAIWTGSPIPEEQEHYILLMSNAAFEQGERQLAEIEDYDLRNEETLLLYVALIKEQ